MCIQVPDQHANGLIGTKVIRIPMKVLKKGLTLVCGHYGTGKTNLSINLAVECARSGKDVVLVDLDIVNPYFRSSDYADVLKKENVRVIGPIFANSNADTPSLPAEMGTVLADENKIVIVDVGGDDVGATALGRYAEIITKRGYDMIYVINRYRSMTSTPEEAAEILVEIEHACGLKANAIVNNSHLKEQTGKDTILDSLCFADCTAKMLGLPISFTTAPRSISHALNNIPNVYPIDIYVRTPWEQGGEDKCQE